MRTNLFTVAVVLCGLGAVLDLGYHLGRQGMMRVAEGQAAGGDDVLLSAANTQNDVYLFVYNKSTKQVTTYAQRQNAGLELKGIRAITSDFSTEIDEYPKSQSPTAVRNMKKLLQQFGKDKEKDK